MYVTRKSLVSGVIRTIDMPIDPIRYDEWKIGRKPIQSVFPELSDDQREFLMTGITPEEWDETFNDD